MSARALAAPSTAMINQLSNAAPSNQQAFEGEDGVHRGEVEEGAPVEGGDKPHMQADGEEIEGEDPSG